MFSSQCLRKNDQSQNRSMISLQKFIGCNFIGQQHLSRLLNEEMTTEHLSQSIQQQNPQDHETWTRFDYAGAGKPFNKLAHSRITPRRAAAAFDSSPKVCSSLCNFAAFLLSLLLSVCLRAEEQ